MEDSRYLEYYDLSLSYALETALLIVALWNQTSCGFSETRRHRQSGCVPSS